MPAAGSGFYRECMRIVDRLVPWIVGVFVVTIAIAAVYLGLQQLNRSAADDAGGRLASQVISAGSVGAGPDASTPAGPDARVDLATSLAPFFIVYDRSGTPVAGTGYLDGSLGRIPSGVVRSALANGTDRVTWQPRPGLRFAAVALKDGDRVVLAAQSLKPTEDRIDRLGMALVLGWVVAVFILAIGAAAHLWLGRIQDAGAGARDAGSRR